jgi:NAD(P) transhydrogenase subunit alpha
MMKDNIITIDWEDEILAKTVLTHDGQLKNQPAAHPAAADATPTKKAAARVA